MMKRKVTDRLTVLGVAGALITLSAMLTLMFIAIAPAQATAVLTGSYAGEAAGVDVNGHQIHELTTWTFVNGALTNFQEVITFSTGTTTVACGFSPSVKGPYKFVTGTAPNANDYILMQSFGCPNASLNNRAEALQVVEQNTGNEFSFVEYTSPYAHELDADAAAHLSGHATRQ